MAGGNIKVVVRVRPLNSREIQRSAKCVVRMKDNQTTLIPPAEAEERLRGAKGTDGQKTFAFDRSYWSFSKQDEHFAGQDDLFKDLGKPLLDNAFQGYNNCIFAYGQTGSGKSYSMMGYGEEAGVIPKICQSMFTRIREYQNQDNHLKYTVEVSYLEIYNERVRDLLNPANKGNLKVREHPSTGPYVEDLAKLAVRSFEEIEHLMDEGNKARTVAATNMNETSSRSHAVFTLTVTQKRHDVETKMAGEKVAKISLVDLAGSERATSTGATGARLKEGAEINRSLSTLGRVIAALADLSTGKKKNMSMVPYRDSVLTWLLKDSLGGNSLTAMIAAISPADINFEETLSTLRYADSAKRIKNHAVVNEDPNARMIRELKEELAQLRSKLGSGPSVGGGTADQYAPGTPLDKQIVSITQADGTIKQVSKAEIVEQLNQSEKLYEDLNQTWEEKLEKTELIQKEREAALEELGISIEKGFVGVSTPKRMPHLVNLSDDPLLAECLVYNIKPGITMVGNVEDPSEKTEIRLNGSKILKEHCSFENIDGQVTLIPKENATIMVNGTRVEKAIRLRSANRIILGEFHIFRFNHPQEAREERKEQSLLRHSVTVDQLGSPAPRPGHMRTSSRFDFDVDADSEQSDTPTNVRSRESDWSLARREAVGAILGGEQKISTLTNDELDVLFEDIQRARASRKGRSESRIMQPNDEDSDSTSPFPIREKYTSNGTLDSFSLDTALTIPSTPPTLAAEMAGSEDGRLMTMREELQEQLIRQKSEFEEQIRALMDSSSQSKAEMQAEKAKMQESLNAAKSGISERLEDQMNHETENSTSPMISPNMKLPRVTVDGLTDLPPEEKAIVRKFSACWRSIGYVRLSEAILCNTAALKEAQILSQSMGNRIDYQFCVLTAGQDLGSVYDLVSQDHLEEQDEILETAARPCIAIRVIDRQSSVIRLWSIRKLQQRLLTMRLAQQLSSRPDSLQHFRPESALLDSDTPNFSLIAHDATPLSAVFEARVEDRTLLLRSPYTMEIIAVVKLSLEPSVAQAPPDMLKFNVVIHEVSGLAEREGTEIHCQMSINGINSEAGYSSTQRKSQFDENAIHFDTVHSMSVPKIGSGHHRLHLSLFGKVTNMHLDKLISWDGIRETSPQQASTISRKSIRVPKKLDLNQEEHDVFTKFKILEMSESGEYVPVEAEQDGQLDPGVFQLRQGLQRRIMINIVCSSSEAIQWRKVSSVRAGNIVLMREDGSAPDHVDDGLPVELRIVQEPKLLQDSNGVKEMTIIAQWETSLHGSCMLDRITGQGYLVSINFALEISSDRVSRPYVFNLQQRLQIHPRSWLRAQSMFKQFMSPTRIIHYTTSIYCVTLCSAATKRAADVLRIDTRNTYVTGEEALAGWQPRGLGLVKDFARCRQEQEYAIDVHVTRVLLARKRGGDSKGSSRVDESLSGQEQILKRVLALWTTKRQVPGRVLLGQASDDPDEDANAQVFANGTHDQRRSASTQSSILTQPQLSATITHQTKNPNCVRSSFLLTPTTSTTPSSATIQTANPSTKTSITWLRHFAELRPPYLHLYAVPSGDETATINLRHARIDIEPSIQRLLDPVIDSQSGKWINASPKSHSHKNGSIGGKGNIWAVYARGSSWIFAAKNESDKSEWVWAVDRAFAGSGSATPALVNGE